MMVPFRGFGENIVPRSLDAKHRQLPSLNREFSLNTGPRHKGLPSAARVTIVEHAKAPKSFSLTPDEVADGQRREESHPDPATF